MKEFFEWFTPLNWWKIKLGFYLLVALIVDIFIFSILNFNALATFMGILAFDIYWGKLAYKKLKNEINKE